MNVSIAGSISVSPVSAGEIAKTIERLAAEADKLNEQHVRERVAQMRLECDSQRELPV